MQIDNKNKKRILVGIIVVLILINLTALGTLGYHKYKRDHNNKANWKKNAPFEKREDRIKQFVKRELKLNNEQCPLYYHSMDRNFALTKLMLENIDRCKHQIMLQITKDKPDTLLINQLSDSLGYFHSKMQRETNRHFMDVMKMLDSGQKVKLKEILIRMDRKDWNRGDNNKNQNFKPGRDRS